MSRKLLGNRALPARVSRRDHIWRTNICEVAGGDYGSEVGRRLAPETWSLACKHGVPSSGRCRKRPGSRWGVRRARQHAAQSSEQSCGPPYKGTRARGSRCPPPVCAGIRACGALQRFPPTPPCPERCGARVVRPGACVHGVSDMRAELRLVHVPVLAVGAEPLTDSGGLPARRVYRGSRRRGRPGTARRYSSGFGTR